MEKELEVVMEVDAEVPEVVLEVDVVELEVVLDVDVQMTLQYLELK